MSSAVFPQGSVWDIFKLILSIPHKSGNELALAERLAEEARARGLAVQRDAYGNLRIDRAASPGYEDQPTVIMQGHLDMVCEKLDGLDFDFAVQGIETETVDGFLRARGTTLGADNGIGCAMALAMLFDENYCGRSIAGVFTREEETGLTGASNLTCEMLQGKYLLNLDSDVEGEFCIGCAGGARLEINSKIPFVKAVDGYCVEITVSGLPGGHSGVEIDKKHGNALVFLAGILNEIKLDVISVHCMNADNVIPSTAIARVISPVPPEELANICCTLADGYKSSLCADAALEVSFDDISPSDKMWQTAWKDAVIKAMVHVPDGVIEYSSEFGVPETSSNFASCKEIDGVLSMRFSQRSLDNAKRKEATERVIAAFSEVDHQAMVSNIYSGWNPVENAYINKVASAVWEKLYGTKPVIRVIHAGLEAGILSKINPELELISFGPSAYDIHSVKERVEIASVERVYAYLCELVKTL